MAAHAKLSASGAHRWLACPGSVAAEQAMPRGASSPYADEGSKAHELAEAALAHGGNCYAFEGRYLEQYNASPVEREMCDYVQEYVDFVRGLGGEQEYEQRVSYEQWVPGGFGTADVIAYTDRTLYVCDLKYGKGIRVDAERNPQGMLYALGALAERDGIEPVDRVVVVIHQPRLDHISEWETTPEEIYQWADWVSERAALALSGDAERVPGESQCRWCAAQPTCPALRDHTQRIVMRDFEDMDGAPAPDKLSDEQLRVVMDNKALIAGWLDAVEKHITERLTAGESFGGYKLVEGRSVRRWTDEQQAERVLSDSLGNDAFERKLLPPAKAEKALGKAKAKDLQALIVKPAGKPVLAPEHDKRKAISGKICPSEFDSIE